MKPHSRSAMLATTLLFTFFFSRPTTAATLPKEFTGVWIVAAETDNECKKQDWKAAGMSDRLINITAKAFERWLDVCTIRSVKTSRELSGWKEGRPPKPIFAGVPTSEVNLSCSGVGEGGGTSRSRQIWYVQNVDSRKILAVTVLEKKVSAMIALECK